MILSVTQLVAEEFEPKTVLFQSLQTLCSVGLRKIGCYQDIKRGSE